MTTRTKTTRLTKDDLLLLRDTGEDNYLVWNDSNDPLIYWAVTERTARTPI